jgi:3-deoxy-7-phosphoheptulonate synthase
MIIFLKKDSTESDIKDIIKILNTYDINIQRFDNREKSILISCSDKINKIDLSFLKRRKSVEKIINIEKPYYLVTRKYKSENSIISINKIKIGDGNLTLIAGPCSVESKSQIKEIAYFLKEQDIKLLRGGIFKPRTSPYSFQGLGMKGLEYLKEASEETGLNIVTEILQTEDIKKLVDIVDIYQIGTRNMYNYPLLKAVGKTKKPIILKRAISGTIDEWLLAAEYIMLEGNSNVILCERGIRTFNDHMRNTLDISAIPYIKSISHLPIITDPSHSSGNFKYVPALAKASVVAGADGVMIETHPKPEESLSDSEQALSFEDFSELKSTLMILSKNINKK